ncbi:hypothetical protein LEP1GSC151_4379 [Leptospira interrogans serovar Grippotyphosa str. LT2186]|uniref:Uncharacterized protein n=1 Tax=Leptospira interrogans serovar Grippotyphosa str. LT2186 TaxID=1001599 RepID=M3IDD1_LEPIR|nr:hypothetical protein [Leptospira interrogans]EKR47383.1 hypothetical protein LEP1GSC097_4161 [Leptospira interrogans serovar Grippotyphosa str. UI 08368]EMG13341.1 hypothetical protein LEP1GSC151_4379 [Leptospira interrogans serovar Grippotyphosa str. LT2186]EMN80186.1 hypothetical protein LEP1GSC106_4323 [Leptospira interrogans serovar Grippotyphosa str. UI 12764]
MILKSYSTCGVGYGHNRGAGKIFLKVRVSTFMEMIDPGFLVSKNDEILTFQSFTVKYRFVKSSYRFCRFTSF